MLLGHGHCWIRAPPRAMKSGERGHLLPSHLFLTRPSQAHKKIISYEAPPLPPKQQGQSLAILEMGSSNRTNYGSSSALATSKPRGFASLSC